MSDLGSRNEAYDFDVNSSLCDLSSSRLLALSVRCGFRTDHWVIVPSTRSTNHAIVNGSSSNRVGWLQTALENVPFPFGPQTGEPEFFPRFNSMIQSPISTPFRLRGPSPDGRAARYSDRLSWDRPNRSGFV